MNEKQEMALSIASLALDPDELADAVRRSMRIAYAAQVLCRFYGPREGCHCHGNDANCHAPRLWEDEARAFVVAFERRGWLTDPPQDELAIQLEGVNEAAR
jgi:hypothetical protein